MISQLDFFKGLFGEHSQASNYILPDDVMVQAPLPYFYWWI